MLGSVPRHKEEQTLGLSLLPCSALHVFIPTSALPVLAGISLGIKYCNESSFQWNSAFPTPFPSASLHLTPHQAESFVPLCTVTWLIDYLLPLNIDYQWFCWQALPCLLHSELCAFPAAGIYFFFYQLNVQSHEFSCLGTD